MAELSDEMAAAVSAAVDKKLDDAKKEAVAERKNTRTIAWIAGLVGGVPALAATAISLVTFLGQQRLEHDKLGHSDIELAVNSALKSRELTQSKARDEQTAALTKVVEDNKNETSREVSRIEGVTAGAVAVISAQVARANGIDVNDTEKAKLYIENNGQLKAKDGDQAVIALWFLAGNNKESSPRQKEITATAALLAAKYYPESTARRGLDALGAEARKIVKHIEQYSPNLNARKAAEEYLDKVAIQRETNLDDIINAKAIIDGSEPALHRLWQDAKANKNAKGNKNGEANFSAAWGKNPKLEVPLRVVLALAGYEGQLDKVIALALDYKNPQSLIATNYLLSDDLRYDPKFFRPLFEYTKQVIAGSHFSTENFEIGNQIGWYMSLFEGHSVITTSSIIEPNKVLKRQLMPWQSIPFQDRQYILRHLDRSMRERKFSADFAIELSKRTGDWGMAWYYVAAWLEKTPYDPVVGIRSDATQSIYYMLSPQPRSWLDEADNQRQLDAAKKALRVPALDAGQQLWATWKAGYESTAQNLLKKMTGANEGPQSRLNHARGGGTTALLLTP